MGLIERALGGADTLERVGDAAEGLSEVFVPNATRAMELGADIHQATLAAAAAEFEHAGDTWFDRLINGLNRLPRPFMALGTLGLFAYAMTDPEGFSQRMIGLQEVPEPLWWLLGAVVSFYFGARELHYARAAGPEDGRPRAQSRTQSRTLRERARALFQRSEPAPHADNPALRDWDGAE